MSHLFPIENNARIQELLERVSELEQDNSNLRLLEHDIKNNTRFFKALLAASQDGITLTRLDGTIIRTVRSILGFGETTLSGLSIFSLTHPEDHPTLRECYRRLQEDRIGQTTLEMHFFRPNGSPEWMEVTFTDMLDNPAVQAVVCNYRVITKRRQNELAAAELASLIHHAPFAIFTKSIQGEILTWNTGAQNMFGYEWDEIVGQHISTLLRPEDQEHEQKARALVVEQGINSPRTAAVRVAKGGRLVHIELVLSPVITEGHVQGIAHLSYPASPTE